MSRSKPRRDTLSPSLFPFLAVLLCTVGALVLILVLVVGKSQAAVKDAVDTRAERTAQLRVQVESIRDSFREDREKIQLEIEKKRMSLQALEQQTIELTKELEQLSKTSELVDKQLTDDDSVEKIEAAMTELQKQLQEAAEKLKQKLEKPTGEKPVFAIIPFEGTNRTHRRPIYLECRADGIVIQPEGVVIALKDMRPPYGPGNPLDAALRSVRSYYAPKDGSLNSAAYPLLVVRSSGIRTYALARLAMAGWDDQFGYELIEDDMELAFPEGEPALGRELERTLVTARNRQAALVMAMPGRYRQALEELNEDDITFEDGEGGWGADSGLGSSGSGMGTAAAPGSAGSGLGSTEAGFEPGSGATARSSSGAGNSSTDRQLAGGRGGFAFAPDGSLGTGRSEPGSHAINGANPGSSAGTGLQGFATGGDTLSSSGGADGQSAMGRNQTPGSALSPNNGPQSFAEGAFSGNQYTRSPGSASGAQGQNMANQQTTGQSGESGGLQSDREENGQSANTGSTSTFRDAMNAARSKQTGESTSSANLSSSRAESGLGGSQMNSANSEGFGSLGAGSAGEISSDTASQMADMSIRQNDKKENAEAVAKRKGRNWAWSAGPPRETAIVRNIRITCYEDRWVVLPDAGSRDKPVTIMLDVSLQASAEELAKVVASRVDRWGYALSSGYWKPVLQVEVAPRSEKRYEQLSRLLDGSGLQLDRLNPPPTSQPAAK
ncbi:MAG: hypothetical protein IT423_01280 [Pirellulaceae bacterium]|nr:hypothetical protein [Pirellulaceae bacterium]